MCCGGSTDVAVPLLSLMSSLDPTANSVVSQSFMVAVGDELAAGGHLPEFINRTAVYLVSKVGRERQDDQPLAAVGRVGAVPFVPMASCVWADPRSRWQIDASRRKGDAAVE